MSSDGRSRSPGWELSLPGWGATLLCLLACAHSVVAQNAIEFHKTFAVSIAEPVRLDVRLLAGDLEIVYNREGEVSIAAAARSSAGDVPPDFFSTRLGTNSVGNQIEVHEQPLPEASKAQIKISYRIDVPYRTEVYSLLALGKQTITGVMGPVHAHTKEGDVRVSYVSKTVTAQADTGNLYLQVIGERAQATTQAGNISCTRVPEGVNAETGDGDISLMVVGPSTARVKHGSGRVDIGGARGTVVASTDAGDLHVKAAPHDDWRLSSVAGTVRVELPPASAFEVEASSQSGEISIQHGDSDRPAAEGRHFNQKVNGGGKRIELRTNMGRILIG